jgi:two-component system phosphate regulon sensor histidine kinase PhoR
MIAGGLVLQAKWKNTLREHLQGDAMVLADVSATIIPDSENSMVLDAWCQKYRYVANVRITLIGRDGKAVGESNRESIQIANLLDRPEVKEALDSGIGRAIRYSDTFQIDMLYVAKLVEEKNMIIRVAMPMKYEKTTQVI